MVSKLKIRQIDERVKTLEKANDEFAKKNGEFSQQIYDEINDLMDERDLLINGGDLDETEE
ncbi:MAG TPA: hypothetical protein DCW90_22170 [Lachnospiraceae bacterium]|nr:hypothetical protein [Lachnospiraceae bacterium]